MSITILVPTHHKSKEDIINLYHFLHIKSDALIANQNGKNETYELNIDNHKVKVVCTDTVGVSKNRNILLDNAYNDICLCIDDDCPLVDNYIDIVTNFFNTHKCEYVLFNGLVPYEGNRKVHNKKTKKVHSIFDVSYAGGPGLAFKSKCIRKYNFKYNEKMGYPNYIYLGEDTHMLKQICDSKAIFYRSKDILFSVDIDKEDNSTYFKGFEEQFFVVKGVNFKNMFPRIYWFLTIHYCFKLSKQSGLKYQKIRKAFKKGFKITNRYK